MKTLMRKKQILSAVLFGVAVILAVLSFVFLPDEVVVQISPDGNNSSMPKLAAILIPLGLCAAGAIATMVSDETKSAKYIVVSCVGIAVFILMAVVNLL